LRKNPVRGGLFIENHALNILFLFFGGAPRPVRR
jgi:hypothetical protein